MTPAELRAWTQRRGWSVYRLAQALDTPPTTVHRWFRGSRIPPMLPLALETLERRETEAAETRDD